LEDWALIRRLWAEGVPKARIAQRLGVSRTTVIKVVSSDVPPRYERSPRPTSFTVVEPRVRELLEENPDMPATVLAERVGWDGSIRWFRDNVRWLRPEQQPVDRRTGLSGSRATRRSVICIDELEEGRSWPLRPSSHLAGADQVGHEGRPACLVGGPQPLAGVAVEVLAERRVAVP